MEPGIVGRSEHLMEIVKLTTKEQLKELKRNDMLIVQWKEGSTAFKKGEPITITRIYGVNHINEVIVRLKDNLYFNIDMYLENNSVALEAYQVKANF